MSTTRKEHFAALDALAREGIGQGHPEFGARYETALTAGRLATLAPIRTDGEVHARAVMTARAAGHLPGSRGFAISYESAVQDLRGKLEVAQLDAHIAKARAKQATAIAPRTPAVVVPFSQRTQSEPSRFPLKNHHSMDATLTDALAMAEGRMPYDANLATRFRETVIYNGKAMTPDAAKSFASDVQAKNVAIVRASCTEIRRSNGYGPGVPTLTAQPSALERTLVDVVAVAEGRITGDAAGDAFRALAQIRTGGSLLPWHTIEAIQRAANARDLPKVRAIVAAICATVDKPRDAA